MIKLNAWLVVGTIVIIGIIVMVVLNTDESNVEEPVVPVIDIFGPDILSICDAPDEATITGIVPTENNYPRKIVLLDGDNFSGYQELLPQEWFAESIDELDVVVCVETDRTTIQECVYDAEGPNDELAIIYRTKGIAKMYAFTPDGTLFDRIEVEGFDPPRCPNSLVLRDNVEREIYQNGPLLHIFIEEGLAPLATGIHPKQPVYPFDVGEGPIDEQ